MMRCVGYSPSHLVTKSPCHPSVVNRECAMESYQLPLSLLSLPELELLELSLLLELS